MRLPPISTLFPYTTLFRSGMIARAGAAVSQANNVIRALIILAPVISADETPIRVGPGPKSRKRYLLRSEEHTSELQSRRDLVCRLLLEKKKKKKNTIPNKI